MGRIRVMMGWLKACQWCSLFPKDVGSGFLILPSFFCEQKGLMVSGVSVKLEGNHMPGAEPLLPYPRVSGAHGPCEMGNF